MAGLICASSNCRTRYATSLRRSASGRPMPGPRQTHAWAGARRDRALAFVLSSPRWDVAAIGDRSARTLLDGVVAVVGQGVLVAALVGEKLGLAQKAVEAVRATRDKGRMGSGLGAAG